MKTILLPFIALACFAGQSSAEAETKSDQPNFIILFIDDMGWRDWSGNGSDFIETPNIDALGEQGIVFDQGYVNASNCAPSRCAILSGQYPPRNHFYNVWTIHRGNKNDRLSLDDVKDGQTLYDERITFAESLKKAGYKTAMYGKWHVEGEAEIMPAQQGFDTVLAHKAGLLKEIYKETGDPKHIYGYGKAAMEFAEESVKEGKPFLIYLAHHAVHAPIAATPESTALYEDKAPGKINSKPKYAGMMTDVDKSIGTMMEKLKTLGIDDNTVVIFLSDNGGTPSTCTQPPLRAFKGSYYEGGIRVPFIVRCPAKFAPAKSSTPVMAIDIYPTMLDLAGVKDIQKHVDGQALDGTSIVPLLKGENFPARSIFWHFPAYLSGSKAFTGGRDENYRQQPVSVIRKGDWKLHLYMEEWSLDGGREKIDSNNSVELYNLAKDPGEQNNLALENKSKRDEMLDELLAWHKEANAPVPAEPATPKEKRKNKGKGKDKGGR